MAIKKNETLLTTLARKVGATAGAIVVKTSQMKDDVLKAGSATLSRPAEKLPAKKSAAKKPSKKSVVKKVAAKKTSAKKTGSGATAKKKTTRKPATKRK